MLTWAINYIRLYRSCYSGPLKCSTWALTCECMGTCPGHYNYGIETLDKSMLYAVLRALYRYLQFADNMQKWFIDAVSSSRCLCPGDTISYECTVTGIEAESTVWTGSHVGCGGVAEIILFHRHFHQGTGNIHRNSIVARSLSVEGNNYTSQLNDTVTSDTVGKTIVCFHDNGTHATFIFSSKILTITG